LAVNNYSATSNQRKSWNITSILCFNKSFKNIVPFQRARGGISNLGVRCYKSFDWTSGVGVR